VQRTRGADLAEEGLAEELVLRYTGLEGHCILLVTVLLTPGGLTLQLVLGGLEHRDRRGGVRDVSVQTVPRNDTRQGGLPGLSIAKPMSPAR
jgi:hypothetical protein